MGFLRRWFSGAGQAPGDESFDFANLDGADAIVLTTNLNRTVKRFDDAASIRALLAFVKSRGRGWTQPAAGIPVARLRLNFYAGERPLGNFGVDDTFCTAQQLGTFWSQASTVAVREQFFALVGLQEYPEA